MTTRRAHAACLVEAGIPVIEIWEPPKRPIGHVVGFSNRKAAAAMTQHLDRSRAEPHRLHWRGRRHGTRGAERRRASSMRCKSAGLDAVALDRNCRPAHQHDAGTRGDDGPAAADGRTPMLSCAFPILAAFGAITACQIAGAPCLTISRLRDLAISKSLAALFRPSQRLRSVASKLDDARGCSCSNFCKARVGTPTVATTGDN